MNIPKIPDVVSAPLMAASIVMALGATAGCNDSQDYRLNVVEIAKKDAAKAVSACIADIPAVTTEGERANNEAECRSLYDTVKNKRVMEMEGMASSAQ